MKKTRADLWQEVLALYPCLSIFNIDGNQYGGYIKVKELQKLLDELKLRHDLLESIPKKTIVSKAQGYAVEKWVEK